MQPFKWGRHGARHAVLLQNVWKILPLREAVRLRAGRAGFRYEA